ncbi:hypothetical protein K440DRAFT_678924 [Wilcoxina mikolae CBS 423.85]|nr:hypothetical protein K440DRAFT_678924 [Wilcoxina mikolae CBS 423.85]
MAMTTITVSVLRFLVEECRKEIFKRGGHGFCSQYLQPKTKTITKVVTRTKPGVTVVQTDTSTEVVTETTTEIVTETTTDVVTETSTTTVATTTATLPFENRARALEKRYHPSIPYWLRSYDSDVIYAACSRVIKPPRTRTITRTRTKYVAGPRTTTVTTVPTTLTTFVPTTLTTTESTTTTTTTTASATETVTVPHPCNDLTTSSGRLYTNVIAAGILNAPPNAYSWIENLSPRECCARCHDEPFRRCNVWMLFETSFQGTAFTCGLIYDYDGSSNTISDTCPKGTPDIWLVQDLGNGRPQNVGGPGRPFVIGMVICILISRGGTWNMQFMYM